MTAFQSFSFSSVPARLLAVRVGSHCSGWMNRLYACRTGDSSSLKAQSPLHRLSQNLESNVAGALLSPLSR